MSSTAHFFYNSRRNDGQRSFFRTLRDPFMGSYDFGFAIKLYLRKEQTTKLSVKRGTSTSMYVVVTLKTRNDTILNTGAKIVKTYQLQ